MLSAAEDGPIYENSSTFRYMLGNIYLPDTLVDPNLVSYRDQIIALINTARSYIDSRPYYYIV
jgi:hypothetical protein